jgi:hypothetical protein
MRYPLEAPAHVVGAEILRRITGLRKVSKLTRRQAWCMDRAGLINRADGWSLFPRESS